MFNKPSLFPKGGADGGMQSGVAPRGGRLVPGGASGAVANGDAPGRDTAGGAGSVTSQSTAQGLVASVRREAPPEYQAGESQLLVGRGVNLKCAEIQDCETVVVEGRVDGRLESSRVLRIAAEGAFYGTASVDVAEIHGRFEGELTARAQLIIHATGRVSGKLRYGRIHIDEGGEVSGDIHSVDAAADKPANPQGGTAGQLEDRAEASASADGPTQD